MQVLLIINNSTHMCPTAGLGSLLRECRPTQTNYWLGTSQIIEGFNLLRQTGIFTMFSFTVSIVCRHTPPYLQVFILNFSRFLYCLYARHPAVVDCPSAGSKVFTVCGKTSIPNLTYHSTNVIKPKGLSNFLTVYFVIRLFHLTRQHLTTHAVV